MSRRDVFSYFIFQLFLISLLLSCAGEINSTDYQITKSKAIDIVLSDIIASDTLEKGLYIYPEIINAGKSVICFHTNQNYSVDYDSWFFFIDDMLSPDWSHPCRYVFINQSNGTYKIYAGTWPPQYYWSSQLEVVKEWYFYKP
jgi:hypothetical protein